MDLAGKYQSGSEVTAEVMARYARAARTADTTLSLCEASAVLIAGTRRRMTSARQVMAPWQRRRIAGGSPEGDGGAGDHLHDRVCDLLASGVLPRNNGHRVWAGKGSGAACRVCERPIAADDVEFEMAGVRLHRACHAAWLRAVSLS